MAKGFVLLGKNDMLFCKFQTVFWRIQNTGLNNIGLRHTVWALDGPMLTHILYCRWGEIVNNSECGIGTVYTELGERDCR